MHLNVNDVKNYLTSAETFVSSFDVSVWIGSKKQYSSEQGNRIIYNIGKLLCCSNSDSPPQLIEYTLHELMLLPEVSGLVSLEPSFGQQ